jgi:hypothetical protein
MVRKRQLTALKEVAERLMELRIIYNFQEKNNNLKS